MKIFANRKIEGLFWRIGICILGFTSVSAAFLVCGAGHAALYILLGSLCMGGVVLALCFGYFREQDDIMGHAAGQIEEYLSGSRDARIECDEEGELYRLFHEVNSLAAILNAHAEKEGRARMFLKDTISNISHQLKTPLAALNIYNGLLQDEAEELPEIKELAVLSEQELDRIETLVQSLLKIARLDADTIVFEKTPEYVADIINDVEMHFAYRAGQEGKTIFLSGADDVLLSCDRGWMTEALGNIVKNALDHTKRGDDIRIEWKKSASAVQIKIQDNGSGIHPEDLYHIFKKFYRSRFSKDIPGTGLGLPLAKAVIEAHDGAVEVESEPGAGTAFLLIFNLCG